MNNEVDNRVAYVEQLRNEEPKKGWRKELEQIGSWMFPKDTGDKWLEQMRGNLGLIATVIATITFQTALNPPGGVRPVRDDGDNHSDVIACSPFNNDGHLHHLKLCPGEAVLGYTFPDRYSHFLFWNTICFIASLSVLFLLLCGIRLSHRIFIWILSIGMCLTLTSLVATYFIALDMVTPNPVWIAAVGLKKMLMYTCAGMLLFLALFLTLRITLWGVIRKKDKMAITSNITRENTPPA